jgi:hypothetical protein
MELILSLIRRRYCYQRVSLNDRTVIKIMDITSRNKVVATIYDDEMINIIIRYLYPCPR